MAAPIPAKLKTPDISRFAQRAAQVEAVKPALAYWCTYYMVQQILTKGLHNQDEECKVYTSQLMDKLEEMKAQHPEDAAIVDDLAGQAYVEQFGLQTFQRADKAMSANKATRQTADTFLAAAVFLDLLQLWGAPSAEIAAKVKYAKFHALRIAKALKAGEDPNLSNPEPAPEPASEDVMALDPQDPEVREIMDAGGKSGATTENNSSSLKATVEDVPEDEQAPPSALYHTAPASDAEETTQLDAGSNGNSRHGSVGGGYFPELQLPQVPQDPAGSASHYESGPVSPSAYITPSSPLPPRHHSTVRQPAPSMPPPTQLPPPTASIPRQTAPFAQPAPVVPLVPPPQPTHASRSNAAHDLQAVVADEEAMLLAQKHAKWAISALNFEDVPTAVKELRLALQMLGAS